MAFNNTVIIYKPIIGIHIVQFRLNAAPPNLLFSMGWKNDKLYIFFINNRIVKHVFMYTFYHTFT